MFVTDEGEFLDREAAWHEAFRCQQILPPYNPVNPSDRRGVPSSTPAPLFSEDLW